MLIVGSDNMLSVGRDNMLIVGSDDAMIKSTKNMLKFKFDMKDMGLADVILGIKILRASNGHFVSQTHYVNKILRKFNKDDTIVASKHATYSASIVEEGISV